MCKAMRTIMINTGTELLLGDVLNTHLRFVAREIFPLGLRIERQLSVPDGAAIGEALAESMVFDLVFVTGGLGPTTDDVTREAIAELLGLEFEENAEIANAIRHRLTSRGWKLTDRILRQALVPRGATILPNDRGTAPGLYFPKIRRPLRRIFCVPGPPRELHPMFSNLFCRSCVTLLPAKQSHEFATIGSREWANRSWRKRRHADSRDTRNRAGILCATGEVDLRLVGDP